MAPAQSLDAYIQLPKDEDIHDDDGHSSDHYTSSEVSERWKEKRTRHFRETMFPDREKKYKVGTSAYCETPITFVPAADPFIDVHQCIHSTTSLPLPLKFLQRETLVPSCPGRCRVKNEAPATTSLRLLDGPSNRSKLLRVQKWRHFASVGLQFQGPKDMVAIIMQSMG